MGSFAPAVPLPIARLAGVGTVVFLANAALLVLQLVSSRLLAPYIYSDLASWTSIIGVFLAGIALGNAYGGKLADRYPTPATLAAVLLMGAAAAAWMAVAPSLFDGVYRDIPLGVRKPLLASVLCLPAGFVLSLLTPLSIKLGLPDVSHTGRVSGLIFALSTLGCLLGNYITGFYLIPAFMVNTLVFVAAGSLLALSAGTFIVLKLTPPAAPDRESESPEAGPVNSHAFTSIRQAFGVVFLASFCGMTLEMTASRIIAEKLGVSLFTWTGVIGVMLAGTALGNLTGGWIADRSNRAGSTLNPRLVLAGSFIAAGSAVIGILLGQILFTDRDWFESYSLIGQVMGWTFLMFFLPMFLLGTISPQVIRIAVPDTAHVGRVAGRVYAWSTAGAILGTFAAGYLLISLFGVRGTLIAVTFVLGLVSLGIAPVWKNNLLLYAMAITFGGATGGTILTAMKQESVETLVIRESNYYNIKVVRVLREEDGEYVPTGVLHLNLDHLTHSSVRLDDPTYIRYEHEHVQMDFLRAARAETPNPRCLVIGGGGYTFPRYAKTLLPESEIDVVEIDPEVTRVAYEFLGLKQEYNIRNFNMDGRQFVAEKTAPKSYDLIVQDAVNDLSVPAHLVTKEYNEAVKAALKDDGVYLLTIIDEIHHGKLWRATMATLRESFPHVAMVWPYGYTETEARQVYVIYASRKPLDVEELRKKWEQAPGTRPAVGFHTNLVPDTRLEPFLRQEPGIVLTDQYAPVDNLMAEVFRRR